MHRPRFSFLRRTSPQRSRWPISVSILILIVTAASLEVLAAPSPGASHPSEPSPAVSGVRTGASETSRVVLKGEIVDLACYLMHEGQGDTHAACAQACVKGGAPVGLLSDGVLYVLFAPHETTAPFEEAKRLVGKNATVTGILHDRGGMRGLAVTMVAAKS